MSRHEERAYRVGSAKQGLPDLKLQLARLKEDLRQFSGRNPAGAMIAPLKERIAALEAEIAEAEAGRRRDRESQAAADEEGTAGRASSRSTHGHFPPRRR
jgi:hypothetical protein